MLKNLYNFSNKTNKKYFKILIRQFFNKRTSCFNDKFNPLRMSAYEHEEYLKYQVITLFFNRQSLRLNK